MKKKKSGKWLKYFFLHLLLAGITLLLLCFGVLKLHKYYTGHNKHIKVPNFYNMPIDQLDSIVKANNINYIIIDSVFDRSRPKGVVIKQDPDSSTNVKKNRSIYLVINSLQRRKVFFPDIYDLSLRQAIRQLDINKLEVGELEYRANIATNKVLGYKINGIDVEIGQELYSGTIVDLVVGKGLGKEDVVVPNLIGLTRVEANIILKSVSLNIGSELFISVEDSASAIIYKQIPIGDDNNILGIGSTIDLFFHQNENNTF